MEIHLHAVTMQPEAGKPFQAEYIWTYDCPVVPTDGTLIFLSFTSEKSEPEKWTEETLERLDRWDGKQVAVFSQRWETHRGAFIVFLYVREVTP